MENNNLLAESICGGGEISGMETAIKALQTGEVFLVQPEELMYVLQFLKEDQRFCMNFLSDLTAIDFSDYFEVVYQLFSLPLNHSMTVKIRLGKQGASLPSVVCLWPAANFLEREIYDLMGLIFVGHPDLRRILLPEGFDGHPLRKDYKLPSRQDLR